MKPFKFQYTTEFIKDIRLSGYNSPFKNIEEAKLDIDMADNLWHIKDQLEEGISNVTFTVDYIPNKDGVYEPYFSNLEIKKLKENEKFEIPKLSFWQKIKKYFRKIKVKRRD